ncbi:MAG: hypothetical protein WEC59_02130 [Salibacteraceae bacterium]
MFLRFTIACLFLLFAACNRCIENCENGICQKKNCVCDTWYEGNTCDRSSLEVFEKEYTGYLELNSDVVDTVSFHLKTSGNDPSKMMAEGLNLQLQFLDASRFEIEPQIWRGHQVEGEGQMLINIVSMRFSYVDSSGLNEVLLEAKPTF